MNTKELTPDPFKILHFGLLIYGTEKYLFCFIADSVLRISDQCILFSEYGVHAQVAVCHAVTSRRNSFTLSRNIYILTKCLWLCERHWSSDVDPNGTLHLPQRMHHWRLLSWQITSFFLATCSCILERTL